MATSLELAGVIGGALGVAPATVVQHLRNLQKDGRVTFKGYGRGAARMGPADAAGLLIAAAGSDLVKHSVPTLDSFGDLRPLHIGRRPSGITFLDHLAGRLASAAAAGDDGGDPEDSNIAFRLISATGAEPKPGLPHFAVAASSQARDGVLSFAPAGWDQPFRSEEDVAAQLRGARAGLLRVRIVTRAALRTIAGCL